MATWPASLPQKLEISGFTRSAPDNFRRTEVAQGPAFQEPKYSLSSEPVAGSMVMTKEQVRTLMTFYHDYGSIPFDWVDPMFDEPAQVQFDTSKPYQITPLFGYYYRVSMSIEINP